MCSAYASGSRDEGQRQGRRRRPSGWSSSGWRWTRPRSAQELRSLDLPFAPTPMDKALWCIYSTTAREARRPRGRADDAGPARGRALRWIHEVCEGRQGEREAAAAMMRADVLASGERAFIRDEEAVARFTEARFPFADEKTRLASPSESRSSTRSRRREEAGPEEGRLDAGTAGGSGRCAEEGRAVQLRHLEAGLKSKRVRGAGP